MPETLSQAEIQAQLPAPVLHKRIPKEGMVHAVFLSRRGQVLAVRSVLDFLGAHMQGEQVTENKC